MIKDEELIESGFTAIEVERIHTFFTSDKSSLDDTIYALAQRFRRFSILTLVMLFVYFLMFLLGTREEAGTFGVSMVVALVIIWFQQLPLLAYKAWRFTRNRV